MYAPHRTSHIQLISNAPSLKSHKLFAHVCRFRPGHRPAGGFRSVHRLYPGRWALSSCPPQWARQRVRPFTRAKGGLRFRFARPCHDHLLAELAMRIMSHSCAVFLQRNRTCLVGPLPKAQCLLPGNPRQNSSKSPPPSTASISPPTLRPIKTTPGSPSSKTPSPSSNPTPRTAQ